MLVIRRRAGEGLVIGDNIEIEVLESSGSQVKLGIRAPKEISVLRKEIRIVGDQNRAAAQPVPPDDLLHALSVLTEVGKIQ
jgi:carbon storage regulator